MLDDRRRDHHRKLILESSFFLRQEQLPTKFLSKSNDLVMQDNEYIETQFQYLNDLRREEMKNRGDVPLASLQMIAWCKAVRPLGP